MSDIIRYVLQHWLQLCLSFFLILAASRLNLKQDIRSRQLLMVPLAFVFLFAAALSASRFNLYLEELIGEYAAALSEMDNQQLQTVGSMLDREAAGNFSSFIFALENALILIGYLGFKRLMLSFLSLICVKFPGLHRTLASTLYDEDEENGQWYLREDMVQVRSFMAIVFWSFAVILLLLAQVCCYLLEEFELRSLFYPVCMILFIGEMYFVTDGRTMTEEQPEALTEENTEPESVGDAESTAEYLKSLFGDHLSAWGRTEAVETSDEDEKNGAADSLIVSDDRAEAAYGLFLKKRARQGFRTDPGYIRAGQTLLGGSSVLFHDPFYKDLIPYIFYPMHHFLLEHGKALIISGRQGAEQE
ncbi:MAG: hypothetical protein PUC98_03085, partial [Clostridiales bacterium]|nr:hypothetical protein [Clostridiales bacterium]